jgi:hypothetical protein
MWSDSLVLSGFYQAPLNGIESQAGAFQNEQKILLGYGTVGGMNQLPPATDGLLDLYLCFFPDNQGID